MAQLTLRGSKIVLPHRDSTSSRCRASPIVAYQERMETIQRFSFSLRFTSKILPRSSELEIVSDPTCHVRRLPKDRSEETAFSWDLASFASGGRGRCDDESHALPFPRITHVPRMGREYDVAPWEGHMRGIAYFFPVSFLCAILTNHPKAAR